MATDDNSQSSIDNNSYKHEHIASNAGPTVTPKFVTIVEDMLNDGEQVYHVIRGPNAGVGDSSRNAETTSTGTKGFVTTAFTNQRIIIKVPHFFADDRYTVWYENIHGVELNSESALSVRSFSIHTAGKDYWVGIMGTMDNEDLHEIRKFVDMGIHNMNHTTTGQNTSSTQEKLEELNRLQENGLISKNEFESKRTEILNDF